MKADYAHFGDVVYFDTTHKKNKEGRPFALFVGVNHHKQTVVFGAALLYDETAKTFGWVFNAFLHAMNQKKHKTILTDQDAAMASTLKNNKNWKGVKHRLCIWHIYQNAASHLSSVFESFPNFCEDLKSCIYDYEDEDDFFDAWNKMLDKYALQNNDWLKKLFQIKEKWALVYGRQTFCADMTTTQRSESMHSVLKRYVNNKHNLLNFFEQFEKLIDDRRYEELKADMRTCHSTPSLSLEIEILKHARSVYTHEVFKLFQVELGKAHDASIEIISESETIYQYKITPCRKKYNHTVTYDTSNSKVSCSCNKFEFAGILCAHVLKVFNTHNIMEIPQMYINKRWTKQAKKWLVGNSLEPCAASHVPLENKKKEEYEKIRIGERYRELCRVYNQLVTRAALTEETFESVKNICFKKLEDVDLILEKGMAKLSLDPTPVTEVTLVPSETEKRILDFEEINEDIDMQELEPPENVEERTITDFHGTTIRGLRMKQGLKDKSGKRFKSALEQAISKKRKNKKTMSPDNAIETDNQNVGVGNCNPHEQIISKKQSNKKINSSSAKLSFDNQNVVGNCNPNTTSYVQTTPYSSLPSLPPYYQNYLVGVPNWNLPRPSLRLPYRQYINGLPHVAQHELFKLGPNAYHQYACHPQPVEKDQPNMSYAKLLQAQDLGISLNNTTHETPQHNDINQVGDPAKK